VYERVGIPRESTFLDMGPAFRGTPTRCVRCRAPLFYPHPPPRVTHAG